MKEAVTQMESMEKCSIREIAGVVGLMVDYTKGVE